VDDALSCGFTGLVLLHGIVAAAQQAAGIAWAPTLHTLAAPTCALSRRSLWIFLRLLLPRALIIVGNVVSCCMRMNPVLSSLDASYIESDVCLHPSPLAADYGMMVASFLPPAEKAGPTQSARALAQSEALAPFAQFLVHSRYGF